MSGRVLLAVGRWLDVVIGDAHRAPRRLAVAAVGRHARGAAAARGELGAKAAPSPSPYCAGDGRTSSVHAGGRRCGGDGDDGVSSLYGASGRAQAVAIVAKAQTGAAGEQVTGSRRPSPEGSRLPCGRAVTNSDAGSPARTAPRRRRCTRVRRRRRRDCHCKRRAARARRSSFAEREAVPTGGPHRVASGVPVAAVGDCNGAFVVVLAVVAVAERADERAEEHRRRTSSDAVGVDRLMQRGRSPARVAALPFVATVRGAAAELARRAR